MTSVEVVLIDADGVLQRPRKRWRAAFAELPALSDTSILDRFARDLLDLEATLLDRDDDFDAALTGMLVASRYDVEPQAILSILNAIEVDTAVLDVVQSVRAAGTKCYLATNQQSNRANYMSDELGYADVFDGQFYSCRLGVAKPQAEFFERIAEDLRLRAQQFLFIDDRPENVAAAIDVGMRAEVFIGETGSAVLVDWLAKHRVPLLHRHVG